MDVHILSKLIVLVILLSLSAFFSSAETALTTVNKIKLLSMVEEDGNQKAKRVLKVINRPKKMLSAILIGNNIVNLSASSLATTLAIDIFGSVGAGIATGILTVLILIFGEITPKSIATIDALKISMRFAPIIDFIMWILTPVIVIINVLAGICIRIFGLDPDLEDAAPTEEEIKTMVNVSSQKGEIEDDEREMIYKVFDFTDATAKEVMIPRIDMTMVDSDISYEELLKVYKENMYTRIPVCKPGTDEVVGLINMKDFVLVSDTADFSIEKYIREAYFTYEMKNVSDLFDEMRAESIALSIVLDEYGSLSGMITLEDLLEEIVGEIRDEYDQNEEDPLIKISAREYEVVGSMNLEDLCTILPLGFKSDDYDTIAGYMTGVFDHFPNTGETYVSSDGVIIRVDATNGRRIEKLHIKLPKHLVQDNAQSNI